MSILRATRETLQELADAAAAIVKPEQADRCGYYAAVEAMNDDKRERLRAAILRARRRLEPGTPRARMERAGDHWDVVAADGRTVLVNESYTIASAVVAGLNDPSTIDPTTEVAEVCERINAGSPGREWFT